MLSISDEKLNLLNKDLILTNTNDEMKILKNIKKNFDFVDVQSLSNYVKKSNQSTKKETFDLKSRCFSVIKIKYIYKKKYFF